MARRRGRKVSVERVLIGYVPVFTRKLLISDPACVEGFVSDRPSRTKRKRDFSFSGACAATRTARRAAELSEGSSGQPVAIAAAAPGNKDYPVFALVRGKKIVRIVIVFDGDPCRERQRPRRRES